MFLILKSKSLDNADIDIVLSFQQYVKQSHDECDT